MKQGEEEENEEEEMERKLAELKAEEVADLKRFVTASLLLFLLLILCVSVLLCEYLFVS